MTVSQRIAKLAFQDTMFLQVGIVNPFSIIKIDLETKKMCFSNEELAALNKF